MLSLENVIKESFIPLGRAGTVRSLSELLAAGQERASALAMKEDKYAQILKDNFSEAMSLWEHKSARFPLEDSFFQDPSIFELAAELMREWALLGSVKTLNAVVLGAGVGYSAISLALVLSSTNLLLSGWDIKITGLELSQANIKKAKEGLYEDKDIKGLPREIRKCFRQKGGLWRYTASAPKISYLWGDPYVSHPSNQLANFRGSADLVLCRYLSREAAGSLYNVIPDTVEMLLKEGGIAFAAPDELWVPKGAISLEERSGVLYFRKGANKNKRNFFFKAKNEREKVPILTLETNDDPGLHFYLEKTKKALEEGSYAARDLASQTLTLAQELGVISPKAIEQLKLAEINDGRYEFAKMIGELLELLA
jgi:chemotaxis methyl-accepting protein methylase